MTARLLLANALELVAGVGVAALLRLPLGTSYLVGLAAVGIVSAELALVHVAVGWPLLVVFAALGAAVAVRLRVRLRPRFRPRVLDVVGFGLLTALFVNAWPAFASRPLADYDGWAIWGMKAKALYLHGWADPALFASPAAIPVHPDYPLLVPSLEAIAARAMGGFDPRLVHLQFLLVGVAGIAAFFGLLRDRVRPWLLWPMLLALVAAPAVSDQLITAYADVPLALFVAAGLLAAARWLMGVSPRGLAAAALFFAAAALTKNEALIFVVGALVGLVLAGAPWRPVAAAAIAVEAALAPWQLYLAINDVGSGITGSHGSPHGPGIFAFLVEQVLDTMLSLQSWSLLFPLFCVAVIAAAGSRLAVFAWTWALVSIIGVASIYEVAQGDWWPYFLYSGYRVVDSAVIGAAVLTPLLASEALATLRAR